MRIIAVVGILCGALALLGCEEDGDEHYHIQDSVIIEGHESSTILLDSQNDNRTPEAD